MKHESDEVRKQGYTGSEIFNKAVRTVHSNLILKKALKMKQNLDMSLLLNCSQHHYEEKGLQTYV